MNSLTFTFAICCRPSVCLSSVCLSVTLVHPIQAVEIFGNILRHLVPWPSVEILENFTVLSGTPPPGELNTRGVAKYSDFGPIEGYIWETAGSNYRLGCLGFPRHWSVLSQALLQPKTSQEGILFIPGSARLCLTTTAKVIDSTEHVA